MHLDMNAYAWYVRVRLDMNAYAWYMRYEHSKQICMRMNVYVCMHVCKRMYRCVCLNVSASIGTCLSNPGVERTNLVNIRIIYFDKIKQKTLADLILPPHFKTSLERYITTYVWWACLTTLLFRGTTDMEGHGFFKICSPPHTSRCLINLSETS